MSRVNPVRILLFLAVMAPLLVLWANQGDAATDWPKEVDRACTAQRYGLRLAAAKKVAAAGAAAVPAIRGFATKNGLDALPVTLVEAVADQQTVEPAVLELLGEWAASREFFWRAQALRGLARRAPLLPDRADALRKLFASHHGDAAWLMRTHARFGSALLGETGISEQPEADPRARTRLASLLLANSTVPPLQPLIDALADERTFLGDPWGQRIASEAHKALKAWLGDAHPVVEGGNTTASIAAVLDAVTKKSGQQLTTPTVMSDPQTPFAGGFEVLSCKHGDVFVQWTADGEVAGGIDASDRVRLPAGVWQELTKERAALDLGGNLGVVICDSMRLRWTEPDVHARVAPGALPAPSTTWLKHLAQALEEAGRPHLADNLRMALEQFAVR